ncbi:GNAT family N-acetyltransferase [Chitinophaga silvatica]|uniref:GNAT family N-acetyltransferase n=1 Tax=Chitinophaga silvatica TaxID=2282649 RepID=A0A3E1YDK4_9BACT|nr:GNAT family N-acetyltransferase [Chitinophaga silvatica]RFS24563.1 GNAT family N-acetyltransferase [Chitinophaga silvatica]
MAECPNIKTLQGVSINYLCDIFNTAFSDYVVPLHLTPSILQQKIEAENLQLPHSIGAFFNNELGGFILHAPDNDKHPKILYNGGTGVIASHRGQRLVQQMYNKFIPVYQERGIQQLLLEVISTNLPAIKSYSSTGFRKLRLFQCFKGDIKLSKKVPDINIIKNKNPDWAALSKFSDMTPSWSNTIVSMIREAAYIITWEAKIDDKTVGYLTVHRDTRRIRSIGVAKEYRRQGIGNALLKCAVEQLSGPFSIINIDDEQKGIITFLEQAGLTQYISQYEMGMDI